MAYVSNWVPSCEGCGGPFSTLMTLMRVSLSSYYMFLSLSLSINTKLSLSSSSSSSNILSLSLSLSLSLGYYVV